MLTNVPPSPSPSVRVHRRPGCGDPLDPPRAPRQPRGQHLQGVGVLPRPSGSTAGAAVGLRLLQVCRRQPTRRGHARHGGQRDQTPRTGTRRTTQRKSAKSPRSASGLRTRIKVRTEESVDGSGDDPGGTSSNRTSVDAGVPSRGGGRDIRSGRQGGGRRRRGNPSSLASTPGSPRRTRARGSTWRATRSTGGNGRTSRPRSAVKRVRTASRPQTRSDRRKRQRRGGRLSETWRVPERAGQCMRRRRRSST